MVGPDLKDAFSLNDPHFQSLNLKLFCCATSDFLRLQFQVKKEMLLTVMICSSSRITHRRWQPWILWFQ
jgi:hypothetical protein